MFALFIAMQGVAWAGDYTLKDFNGKLATLDDYTGKGKWTIVMIWAHDCRVCNQEVPNYNAFHEKHKNKDAIILGVSADGKKFKKEAEDFIARHKVVFPNLIGESDYIDKLYFSLTGVQWEGTPSFLIYNPQGELLVQQIGAVPTELIEKFMASQTKKTADKES